MYNILILGFDISTASVFSLSILNRTSLEWISKGLQNPSKMKYENPSIRQILLRLMESISKTVELLPCGLSQHLFETMQTNEVLWEAPFPFHMKMVLSMLQTLLLKQCGCEATTQHLNE